MGTVRNPYFTSCVDALIAEDNRDPPRRSCFFPLMLMSIGSAATAFMGSFGDFFALTWNDSFPFAEFEGVCQSFIMAVM